MGRIDLLDKWPPPRKYAHEDWLTWTHADSTTNSALLQYCTEMRKRLSDHMTTEVADEFRASEDPTDRLLWALRNEESKTFKSCVSLANSHGYTSSHDDFTKETTR